MGVCTVENIGNNTFRSFRRNINCVGLFSYDTAHNCTFDYKTVGREELRKSNPQVWIFRFSKIIYWGVMEGQLRNRCLQWNSLRANFIQKIWKKIYFFLCGNVFFSFIGHLGQDPTLLKYWRRLHDVLTGWRLYHLSMSNIYHHIICSFVDCFFCQTNIMEPTSFYHCLWHVNWHDPALLLMSTHCLFLIHYISEKYIYIPINAFNLFVGKR